MGSAETLAHFITAFGRNVNEHAAALAAGLMRRTIGLRRVLFCLVSVRHGA